MIGFRFMRCALNLSESWQLFKQVNFNRLAKKTRAEYKCAYNKALLAIGENPSAPMIADWYSFLLGKYSVSYSNFCITVLKNIGQCALSVRGDSVLSMAVSRVRKAQEPVLLSRCPPSDLMEKVFPACRNNAEKAFLMLAGFCGLRRGELMGLKPSDYDKSVNVLYVQRQRLSPTRKNKRPHIINLTGFDELILCLVWTINNHELLIPAQCKKVESRQYLFPWSRKYLEIFLERIRSGFGDERDKYLPFGMAWHSFRHWGATKLARAGASPVEVQKWLGDSSPDIACKYIDDLRGVTKTTLQRFFDDGKAPIGPKRIERGELAKEPRAMDNCSTTSTTFADVVLFYERVG